ncbi:uncharacterized protein N7496_007145 [Penicillium cataractarum]|uniref:Uncharacterized protein n=1 Tax=Penicillium cataractarum TaxID=2100454 RepID=A0A9W9S7I9_9EURO|nr:uncharacterized protein N7496_007145 [Penicillium cataractarum]KAJ5371053.1 hypothetical protein N7496_007145 [Penicillium cataractarum]
MTWQLICFTIGNPDDWYSIMTSGYSTGGATCSDFPAVDECVSLSEDLCTDGQITSELFWAAFLAQRLYSSMLQWNDAFTAATFISSLDVSTIATTFTPQTQGKTLSFDSFLSGFSTGLGIAASVAPEDDIAVGAFSTGVSNIESIVGFLSSSSSFTLPDESDLETALETLLTELVEGTITAMANLTTAIFKDPNQASGLSSSLIDGPFMYPVSNYFYNSKILFTLDSETFVDMVNTFNSTIKMYMVGAALGDGDYYILRDSSTTEADCTDTAKYYIDGSCYTLAYPGASECIAGMGTQTIATEDTINSITSYGIDVEEMIINSYTCQNTTGQYFGSLEVDVTDLASTGTLPACFFNLPVLDLVPTTITAYTTPFDISPCWITEVTNVTLGTDRIVGETYLPDNLATVFDTSYCSCGGVMLCRRMDVC